MISGRPRRQGPPCDAAHFQSDSIALSSRSKQRLLFTFSHAHLPASCLNGPHVAIVAQQETVSSRRLEVVEEYSNLLISVEHMRRLPVEAAIFVVTRYG